MNDLNKERIRFNTEVIKLLTLLFTTGGAGFALLGENPLTITKLVWGLGGVFFGTACGILAIFAYKNTLKKLKDEHN